MSAHREQRIENENGDGMRTSMRLSRYEDDEDEDFALSSMGISDGFRPSNAAPVSHNRIPSRVSQRDSTGRRSPPPRPSSISKPRGLDSFALRHDGSTGPLRPAGPALSNDNAINRASSVSTNITTITPETPYQGPSGPSHPYHMYPQGTRPARTASVATASTFQPSERSYAGPSGPTHPYGMYPQDTTAGHDTPVPVAAISVGFPGRRDDYQRRIGPDGEEAGDIIGPMGHTEQLPPYTQYPMESFGKPMRIVPPISGAGGMGLATRDPEFASREDLSSPQSRLSLRSMRTDGSGSTHNVNMAALAESEKPPEKRWKQIARKKLCGIVPVWAVVLAGLVLLAFVIILGTVLRVLSKRHPPPHHSGPYSAGDSQGSATGTYYTTVTTTLDASALPSLPTGIPTLPTGAFLLPIFTPYSVQQTCLDSSDLYSAWSCALPMSMLQVTVARINENLNSLNNNNISITHNDNMLDTWFYGSQPPAISTQQTMNLVRDLEQPQLGPAWFFQVPYDKIVIVNENTFTASKKRGEKYSGDKSFNEYDFKRKGVAQPGEKPWFCYWNGTLLETFIYVNNTSSGSSYGAPASGAAASTTPAQTTVTSPSTTTATAASATDGYSRPSFLSPYPKIIKVEERRIPKSPKPYCNQMIIQADGTAMPSLNPDGSRVTVQLHETEPNYQSPAKRNEAAGYLEVLELETRQSTQQCTCVWLTS